MNASARYPSLTDTPVFITGGATGIGASLVIRFCEQGAKVAFVDINIPAGEALLDTCRSMAYPPLFIPCDLIDIDALGKAIARAQAIYGTIRVLINNAANDDRHSIESVSADYWDERIAVNLRHQFFAAQGVIPGMRKAGGGSIINFGSLAWRVGMGGMSVYVTSKAAVEGLTRSLAREVGPFNIRVNTIIPGWVMTERQVQLWLDEEGERTMDRMQCLPGRIMPDDVAAMALFLAADDSHMCTAQAFTVDAGWS